MCLTYIFVSAIIYSCLIIITLMIKMMSGGIPVLGDDYIRALKAIANKHGIKITDKMILNEIFGKQTLNEKQKKKANRGKVGL